tara:strand:+ start:47332 stop:48087 length:756 start_codon:yes stop_codon:yes gene_type:complete
MDIGIKESKLLSDLYEGNDSNVPIGQNILVNDASKVEDRLKPLTSGDPLTSLHVDQFDAFGRELEGKSAKRDTQEDDVEFTTREVVNDGLIVEAAFNAESGTLNLVRRNGDVVQVHDFFVQSDFGIGATGPKGERGYDGHDGDDGEDGLDGEKGCPGAPGELGLIGPMGDPGEDGPHGIAGPIGQEGEVGLQGVQGDQGRYGHEGARGQKGPDCINEGQGAQGAAGKTVNATTVISRSDPGDSAVMWAVPQ